VLAGSADHEGALPIAVQRSLSDNGGVTDLERILSVWRDLKAEGADYVLATVVAVQGPSYRKPGALMLLTADGRRIGTISGGCLEAQVTSRAWWLTANGPTIQRYSTAEDDGDRPYGSGCGGVIFLLLERKTTAGPLLVALERAFALRIPLAVATVLDGAQIGRRAFAGLKAEPPENISDEGAPDRSGRDPLGELAERSLTGNESVEAEIAVGESAARAWAVYRPARPGLAIFGAGDDAQPLLRQAKELGWFVSLADGRTHLVTHARFPEADALSTLPINDLPGIAIDGSASAFAGLRPGDAAIVMTHSFEQDSKILACLLALPNPPAYVGVLGPQRRTRELLGEAARLLDLPASAMAEQTERWLAGLYAPTGLDLGAESPETIALSILAEIQKFRAAATALPLRKVRAAHATVAD
jgi:xanthine/CO dehydrogenase XdhC/CoxF family maturation factor